MIIPGLLGIPVAFWYMLSDDFTVIAIGFIVQGALLGGGAGSQVPSYMTERFPTEARATAVPSAITSEQYSAVLSHRSSPTLPSTTTWGSRSQCWLAAS
jgi:hypothetical protein